LSSKLIARECSYSEASALVLVKNLLKLSVVRVGESTLRSDVDYDDHLSLVLLSQRDFLAVRVLH
ncbi:hypothetical protein PFISCL1PPCAC_6340, partial [Pristionchus fissidentatus]